MLAVAHWVDTDNGGEIFEQARLESTSQQFVLHRVVAARFLDRDPIGLICGKIQADVVADRHLARRTGFGRLAWHHAKEQIALVIERRDGDLVVEVANAGNRFAILLRRLAPDGVGHSGLRHQVAFVGGVDEDLRPVDLTALHTKLSDSGTVFPYLIEQLLVSHLHTGFLQHFEENLLGDSGLPSAAIALRPPAVTSFDGLFKKLFTKATQCLAIQVVALIAVQAARGQPAHVSGLLQEHDRSSFPRCGDCGCDSARRTAVHTDVVFFNRPDTACTQYR